MPAPMDGTISISVADTGRDIPSEHLPCIFDRFYRVDESRTGQDVGLGLAIALDIAKGHSGTINVTSTPDEGTTFNVRLPAAR
jgi:signal transduction histidine kinase